MRITVVRLISAGFLVVTVSVLFVLFSAVVVTIPVGMGWLLQLLLPFSWFEATALIAFVTIGVLALMMLGSIKEKIEDLTSWTKKMKVAGTVLPAADDDNDDTSYGHEFRDGEAADTYADALDDRHLRSFRGPADSSKGRTRRQEARKRC